MSAVVRALLDELGPDDLAELAQRLAPYLPTPEPADDGWLTAKQAADYLGLSTNALHRLTAQQRVPFTQHTPGGKLWFQRSALDAWRRQ